jgi:hypothetical protein
VLGYNPRLIFGKSDSSTSGPSQTMTTFTIGAPTARTAHQMIALTSCR